MKILIDTNIILDALLAERAYRNGMDYIITRNIADFSKSPVQALTPTQFLKTRVC
ncbi:MAG: hypothetical protein FWB98_00670 [Defluviitaleaceae bacterium]|nr:hypothetical protein [Defluviitaleaceae bacterium]